MGMRAQYLQSPPRQPRRRAPKVARVEALLDEDDSLSDLDKLRLQIKELKQENTTLRSQMETVDQKLESLLQCFRFSA